MKKMMILFLLFVLLTSTASAEKRRRSQSTAENGLKNGYVNGLPGGLKNGELKTEKNRRPSEENTTSETNNADTLMYRYSTTVEKEKPELDEVTRQLIANYRKDPTQENYDSLRAQVGINYDKVLAKKQAKLDELKATAKEQSKITEMEEIVAEMITERENRINQSMSRFTDPRLRPDSSVPRDGYVPVMGAAVNVYISQTPVTNREYAQFVAETGYSAPQNWVSGNYAEGQEDYPVVCVSLADAEAYCAWLSGKDSSSVCRLPSEAEWELAAGHMPKDADMNTGHSDGIASVYAYSQTTAASGAIDMWGNVWEWTDTSRDETGGTAVKGGAWDSPKTNCRTENRGESRDQSLCYENVGFRVVKETRQ
ncbi:MAG: SUMF1/EgtB/PvdO family nonheme iron enzyme [Clostridia bacterium]|nr:SUMF1/EgtB/PvdO family nonheme iron enzyme [Clostridia bacterium]